MNFRKEDIINRMHKEASIQWEFPIAESLNTFDPIVSLLFNTIAHELEQIAHEISDSNERVFEKIAEIITPEVFTTAIPAHAIAHAYPLESTAYIQKSKQFFLEKKESNNSSTGKPSTKQVFFSPLGNTKLHQVDLRYFVARDIINEYNTGVAPNVLCRSGSKEKLPANTFWLGLDYNPDIELIEDLVLLFNFNDLSLENAFSYFLLKSKCYLNGHELFFTQGLNGNVGKGKSVINTLNNKTKRFENLIKEYYQNNFITINSSIKVSDFFIHEKYPSEFAKTFEMKHLEKIEDNILWLKFESADILHYDNIEKVICSTNCFPVINRKLNETHHIISKLNNIVPLYTDDFFWDIHEVSDTMGNNIVASDNFNHNDEVQAILRKSGVKRIDQRTASVYINRIRTLIQEEKAAFSFVGQELLASKLTELNQVLANLEQYTEKQQVVNEEIPYLMFMGEFQSLSLFLYFWSTNGAFANRIASGTQLELYEGSDLDAESLFLVTMTTSGRDNLGTEDKIRAFKHSLLTRDRIISKEDIRAFFQFKLGGNLKRFEIVKGVGANSTSGDGLFRTTDLIVSLDEEYFEETEKEELEKNFKDYLIELIQKSNNAFPFRVIVNDEIRIEV